jgi:hypothetical protein
MYLGGSELKTGTSVAGSKAFGITGADTSVLG